MIPPRAVPAANPAFVHKFIGKALGASMWFFVWPPRIRRGLSRIRLFPKLRC